MSTLPRPLTLVAALACLAAAPALAEMDFVTDPELCPLELIERQERGMSFDGADFWKIEYHCALERPIDRPGWTSTETQVRAGYCEEPGAVFPTLFVFRSSEFEKGRIEVFQGDSGEPVVFHLCP